MTTSAKVTATTSVNRRRRLMSTVACPTASTGSQRVADAAHGANEAGLAVGFGLAAQVPDVDVERLRRRLEVVPPDALVDRVARDDDVGVREQQLEQVEFGLRQLELAVAPPRL